MSNKDILKKEETDKELLCSKYWKEEIMRQIIITEKEAGQRLDKFLSKYMSKAPKSFFYKMLRKKNIKLNGAKADGSEKLQVEDEIKLFLSEETIQNFSEEVSVSAVKANLDILYEDTNLLIINKEPGVLSQKAQKDDVSLIEHITAYLLESGQITKEQLKSFHPGVCNRLDRNTSGIIIAGKTLLGLQKMSELLKTRNIDKYYQCIVKGKVTKKQCVEGYLTKNRSHNKVQISTVASEGADYIKTEYEPICATEEYTLLKVKLFTGKSHQIRAHLQSMGHPVIGDGKYGDVATNKMLRKEYKLKHHVLHSWQLVLPELDEPEFAGVSGKTIEAPVPLYFEKLKKALGLRG